MTTMNDIEMQMAEIDINNEENKELVFKEGVEEDNNRFELCLVGRFLTEKSINTHVMKSKMANVWLPAMGINIKDLKSGMFLFQFYHKDDMDWVVKGGGKSKWLREESNSGWENRVGKDEFKPRSSGIQKSDFVQ